MYAWTLHGPWRCDDQLCVLLTSVQKTHWHCVMVVICSRGNSPRHSLHETRGSTASSQVGRYRAVVIFAAAKLRGRERENVSVYTHTHTHTPAVHRMMPPALCLNVCCPCQLHSFLFKASHFLARETGKHNREASSWSSCYPSCLSTHSGNFTRMKWHLNLPSCARHRVSFVSRVILGRLATLSPSFCGWEQRAPTRPLAGSGPAQSDVNTDERSPHAAKQQAEGGFLGAARAWMGGTEKCG